MIQYILYRFYHKQYECQSAAIVVSHKSTLKELSTRGAVGSKGINIFSAWFVTLF
jgi:hypothetical protein